MSRDASSRPDFDAYGSASTYLGLRDFSKLLVAHVREYISRKAIGSPPTQADIARKLGVSQPMIAQVLAGRKNFGQDVFERYAESRDWELSRLVDALLRLYKQGDLASHLMAKAESDVPFAERLIDCADQLHQRIRSERATSLGAAGSGRPFDADQVRISVMDMVLYFASELDITPLAASVVQREGDGLQAEFLVYSRATTPGTQPRSLRDRIAAIPSSVLGMLESSRNRRADSQKSVLQVINTRLLLRSLETIVPGAQTEGIETAVAYFACVHSAGTWPDSTPNDIFLCVLAEVSETSVRRSDFLDLLRQQCDRVAFVAGDLLRLVSHHALEDYVRCSDLVLKDEVSQLKLLTQTCGDNSIERQELLVARLIRALEENPKLSPWLLTLDVWRFDSATMTFEMPSQEFWSVPETKAEKLVTNKNGDRVPLVQLYRSCLKQLQPRSSGKSMYCIANRRAIILSQADRAAWGGVEEMDLGTLIGVPLLLETDGHSPRRWVCILYVRCQISAEQEWETATKVLWEIVETSRSAKFRGRVMPLAVTGVLSNRSDIKTDLVMRSQEYMNVESGRAGRLDVWYEPAECERENCGRDTSVSTACSSVEMQHGSIKCTRSGQGGRVEEITTIRTVGD